MRNAFIKRLGMLAGKDKNVFLLTADLGFKLFDDFRRRYPGRFINFGVAEANMVGSAAGLALSGKNIYCYSMVPFLTMRTFEQIRIDLCYHNLNVKLVGVGGGLVYGFEGVTHQAIEDLSIMRSLPNMSVVAPGDPFEVDALLAESVCHKGPLYMRLGKNNDPIVHSSPPDFRIGKGIVLKKGGDVTVMAAGTMLVTARAVSDKLTKKGIDVNLVSMHTIKPLDKKLVLDCAAGTWAIFTLEEHSVIGGLGSAVAEVLAESGCGVLFRRMALPDAYMADVGSAKYLLGKCGLSAENVTDRILKELKGTAKYRKGAGQGIKKKK